MFLGEPAATGVDLHFRLLGIPVRVSPWFWLMAAILGWDIMQVAGGNRGLLFMLWILAVFVSILVHEFGHALAFRYYGTPSHVVLYHFGGLAVPDGAVGHGRAHHPKSQIVISFAGPAAQLFLAVMIVVLLRVGGFAAPPMPFISEWLPLDGGRVIPSLALNAFALFLVVSSVYWALLNLVPVYPLDGGQIAREVFLLLNVRDGIRYSLMLSIGAGIAVAVYGLQQQNTMMAMLFGLLAWSSYTALQAYSGQGGRYGGGEW